MSGGSPAALSRDIQVLFDEGTAVGLSDRQLLARFAGRRDPADEAAFEALVRRHGPMVLRVCRDARLDPNDAQDAFQTTFLVLVQRCGALKGFESLGGWLHGVACRVAARARVEAARRRAVEGRAALRVVEAVQRSEAEDSERDEHGPIVQEEVRRLPERYRAAVVLCYWEGLTQEQAAAQLGCPLGTVRSRLARARDLLRRRLTRRGLAPMAVAIGAETGLIRKLPPLAPDLVQSTVQAAVRVAAGQAAKEVVCGVVCSLVQRMLWRTTMIKLGGIAAGVILVGLAGYGAGLAAQRAGDAVPIRLAIADERRPAVDPGVSTGTSQTNADFAQAVARPKVEGQESHPLLVRTKVVGGTTIVRIVPNGANVKKGDVICELDSGPIRDRLVDQRIAVKAAEAAYLNARLAREVSELAVKEFVDGDSAIRHQDAEGDIRIAEAELALAEEELNAAKESRQRVVAKRAEVAVLRARFALAKAQSRKQLLANYTKPMKTMELETAVRKAQSDELVKQATWELEKSKEENLKRQIAACTITAPIGGRIRYQHVMAANGIFIQVGEGVVVREREVLFAIEPLD